MEEREGERKTDPQAHYFFPTELKKLLHIVRCWQLLRKNCRSS